MLHARGQSTAELQHQHVDRLHRHTIHTTSAGMAHANGPTARATVNSTSWWWGQEQRVVLNFGDADTTQKATGATLAQIDFVCVICTSNSSTACCCCLSFSPFLSLSLCVFVQGYLTTISPFIYRPFYFFAATTKCLYKRHVIPYYLSTDIDFVCVLCTSSSTASVASLSLPLSLSLSLFRGTSHNNVAISVPALLFFRSCNEVFVQTAFIAYFPSDKYYFSICDHGPDCLHAVICDKLTFFTGGCSEGLGAFRFFFK